MSAIDREMAPKPYGYRLVYMFRQQLGTWHITRTCGTCTMHHGGSTHHIMAKRNATHTATSKPENQSDLATAHTAQRQDRHHITSHHITSQTHHITLQRTIHLMHMPQVGRPHARRCRCACVLLSMSRSGGCPVHVLYSCAICTHAMFVAAPAIHAAMNMYISNCNRKRVDVSATHITPAQHNTEMVKNIVRRRRTITNTRAARASADMYRCAPSAPSMWMERRQYTAVPMPSVLIYGCIVAL